jgi:hypothetical protein
VAIGSPGSAPSPGALAWVGPFMPPFDTESPPAMTFYLGDIVANAF